MEFLWLLRVEFMLDKICSQQHSLDISIKFATSLQHTLECRIPLISMSGIQDFVVRIYTSLQDLLIEAYKSNS